MKKSSKAPIKNDLSENMMRASIVLEKEMHETLRILSFVMDRSVSDMAREALADWLARNEDVAKFAGATQKLKKSLDM